MPKAGSVLLKKVFNPLIRVFGSHNTFYNQPGEWYLIVKLTMMRFKAVAQSFILQRQDVSLFASCFCRKFNNGQQGPFGVDHFFIYSVGR